MSIETFPIATPPKHNNPVFLVFPKEFTPPLADIALYKDGQWSLVWSQLPILPSTFYEECYWFEIPAGPKGPEENIYKFVERVGTKVTQRYGLKENPALSSINADKARQYRDEWEAAGVPFLYGVFIYVMSTTHPYCSEIKDRSKMAEWVISYWKENPRFRRIITEEDTGKAYFTIYWKGGNRQVIPAEPGEPIHKAFGRQGYGNGAVAAIDWYDNGDTNTHEWGKVAGAWVCKEPFTCI